MKRGGDIQVPAGPWVVVHAILDVLLRRVLFVRLLGPAEATVGGARPQQLINHGPVPRSTFRLPVRTMLTTDVRPLIPVEPQPREVA